MTWWIVIYHFAQIGVAAFSLWLLWVVRDSPAAFFMIGAAIFFALLRTY